MRILDERAAAAGTRRRQTALLSATLPAGLEGLASLTLQDPVPIGFKTRLEGGRLRIEPGPAGCGDGAGARSGKGAAATVDALAAARAGGGGAEASSVPPQLKQRFVEVATPACASCNVSHNGECLAWSDYVKRRSPPLDFMRKHQDSFSG